ncbi:MAG: lysophospholipid acyltransferase family protein [Bacteroidetes bacterium]|nr:lysophospholipid acyltransferase family protein [Bacteroidota bacterium]
MRHVWAVSRLFILSLNVALTFLVWAVIHTLLWPWPGIRRAWRRTVWRAWARSVARIFGMSIRVEGSPPSPPFCLVANHLSYMDAIVIMACSPGVMVGKVEVASMPLIGWMARQGGTLFINRSLNRDVTRVGALVTAELDKGEGLIFFPESTTTDGRQILPFRAGLLAHPAATGMPVHAAAIRYEAKGYDASSVICWGDDTPLWEHVYRLFGVRAFRATVRFGRHPVADSDRKQLAARLRDEVASLYFGNGSTHPL